MLTSACVGEATLVVPVAVLFATVGSETVMAMFAVFVSVVPGVVPAATIHTYGNLTMAPTASVKVEFRLQVIGPVLTTPALRQVKFAGTAKEATEVLAGKVSVKVTVVVPEIVIAAGPLFVMDCV